MPRSVKRLEQDSLGELAYLAIRDSIVDGKLPMGQRLVETTLADQLGISRGPVREALRRLKEEGLVMRLPRRGSFVRSFGAKDLVDIYNFRVAIETAAVRLVVRTHASLDELVQQIQRMRLAAEQRDLPGVAEAEFRFHELICELSGNDYLYATFKSLGAQVKMALRLDNETFPSLMDVADEHVALIEVLEAGDESAAAREIEAHIVSTISVVLARYGIGPEELLGSPPRPRIVGEPDLVAST